MRTSTRADIGARLINALSGRMLIQCRGKGRGDSRSVECLFSMTPLPGTRPDPQTAPTTL